MLAVQEQAKMKWAYPSVSAWRSCCHLNCASVFCVFSCFLFSLGLGFPFFMLAGLLLFCCQVQAIWFTPILCFPVVFCNWHVSAPTNTASLTLNMPWGSSFLKGGFTSRSRLLFYLSLCLCERETQTMPGTSTSIHYFSFRGFWLTHCFPEMKLNSR
jgi:hypothetical protein